MRCRPRASRPQMSRNSVKPLIVEGHVSHGFTNATNNFELRRKLQEITDTCTEDKIGEQLQLITELSADYPHSITLLEQKEPGDPNSLRFNCHEYAFGLRGSEKVETISSWYTDIFPDAGFVTLLITRVLTEKSEGNLQTGDLVVYFSDGKVAHSGIYVDGKVRSKWGGGHLWEHGLYEVPLSYGSEPRFFTALPREVSEERFLKDAKRRGHELYPTTFEWPFD